MFIKCVHFSDFILVAEISGASVDAVTIAATKILLNLPVFTRAVIHKG